MRNVPDGLIEGSAEDMALPVAILSGDRAERCAQAWARYRMSNLTSRIVASSRLVRGTS